MKYTKKRTVGGIYESDFCSLGQSATEKSVAITQSNLCRCIKIDVALRFAAHLMKGIAQAQIGNVISLNRE